MTLKKPILQILTRVILIVLWAAPLFFSPFITIVQADEPVTEENKSSWPEEFREHPKKERTGILGTLYYWDQGFKVESPRKNFKLKIGGRMDIDLGYVNGNGDIDQTFSSLDEFNPDLRRLTLSTFTTLYKAVDIKLDIDFANVRTIKDIWFRYKKHPFFRQIRFGHITEPFSLERLTSSQWITFMERALPVNAFSPGRNLGIQFNDSFSDDRFTFGVGFFWNTGSLHEVQNPQDSISDANGYNITARVTGLAWYEDKGRDLMHLGLAYSFGPRNSGDNGTRLSTLPESYVADVALVDTDAFSSDMINRINPELAIVSGPLSFQSEFTYYNADADAEGHLDFWGYYFYFSYFLTGEHRPYDRTKGVFSAVQPKHNFNYRQRRWGAWELGFRHSYVDLADEHIKGGKERNFTMAVNWYFNPNTRVMLNFVRADIDDRDNSRVIKDGKANILQMRFQIHY